METNGNIEEISMSSVPSKKKRILAFFKKKKVIFGIIILVILAFIIFGRKNGNGDGTLTDTVKRQDLKQTVLATGQVTSETDLALSFKASGVVGRINFKVGDQAGSGDVLASLESRDVLARLTQARGALSQAEANYQRVIEGASNEDVAVSQVALNNAKNSLAETKKQQTVLVENAYSALMNNNLEAMAGLGNSGSISVSVSGAYGNTAQGQYKITVYSSSSGLKFQYSGLESGIGDINTSPVPLGTRGLYIQFSGSSVPTNNVWTISIPNTKSSSYITYYNAYQSALETQRTAIATAENAVATAQAALELKKAKARPADLAVAEAQILSAQGQVQAAQAELENTIVRAPASGTITKVDIKVGELASALQPVVILQDVKNLHIEANISEANIASLQIGQEVEVTFDALGLDRKFIAEVQAVDPASTVVSGVVNYKVTVGLENLEEVKPGMTANLNVLTGEKGGVLAIPQRAVLNKDGKKMVRVITDQKTKAYEEKEVSLGMEADGGLVEVTSGLNEGEEIITYLKQ